MPREVFVAGQVLTAAELNVVSDQTVMVFAGTAARGSAIPSPTEGMVTYREDDDVVEVYNGSSFVPVGPGQILQVVSTAKTNTFSTTSTSYVDITDLSISITPQSTSSKIFLLANVMFANTLTGQGVHFQLVRDSTAVYIGDADGSRVRSSFSARFTPTNANSEAYTGAPMFLDSPNTTSSVTYKVQGRVGTAGTLVVNRMGVDTDDASRGRMASSITALEVAG